MSRDNPFDAVLDGVVGSMQAQADIVDKMTKGMSPVDSRALSPEEEMLVYLDPTRKYPGATDPATGQPIDQGLAARMLMHDMGPAAYEKWVIQMEAKRAAPAAGEGASTNVDDQQPLL